MKKVILGVLALIFAIALVIGGYILITSQTLQKYAVEDVSCPYSWKELRDGTYRLEIDTAAYPDCSWGVESYPKKVIAAVEVSSKPGPAVFSILPLNMGQTYVQVYCEQTEPFTVRVFEIGMQINVSENHKITVEKTEEKEYDGIATMGEDEDHPIQWWTKPDGGINLLIAGETGGSWEAVDYDPDSINVVGPFYRESSCGFEIQGMQAGTVPLILYDGGTEAIRLEIEVTEELTAAVTAFSVDTYSFDRSEEHSALETVVGRAIVLPSQVAVTDYSVKSNGGSVDFLLNDQEWRWQISTNSTEEDLVGDIAANASETKTESLHGVSLSAYSFKDGVAVSWNDGNCTMVLYGEREATIAEALAVAGQVVEENHGQ